MTSSLRIALADDQALFRTGLRALLQQMNGFDVIVEASDGAELLAAIQHHRVDVIVSDIRMPKHSGIEVVRALRTRGDYTPALLMTTFEDALILQQAVEAGAQGFLLKHADPEELKEAILTVATGATMLAPQPLAFASRSLATDDTSSRRLTTREVDVLRMVAGGYSNKEIGRALRISDGTVKNHLTEILSKLGARDRTHAVIKAMAARLL